MLQMLNVDGKLLNNQKTQIENVNVEKRRAVAQFCFWKLVLFEKLNLLFVVKNVH